MHFTPYWDYKPTNSPGVYTSNKILNLGVKDEVHLKCDVIDASVVNGFTHPILFTFVLNKAAGCKVFCEPETKQYKKINKSVLTTITFYLENSNNEEVDFNGKTMTFTLQMVRI